MRHVFGKTSGRIDTDLFQWIHGADAEGFEVVHIHGGHGQSSQGGHGSVQTIASRNSFGLAPDVLDQRIDDFQAQGIQQFEMRGVVRGNPVSTGKALGGNQGILT